MITLLKIGQLGIWIAFVVNFFYPLLGENSHWLTWGGLAIFVAHILECIVFRKDIHREYTNPAEGYIVVLLFGVLRTGEWIGKKSKSTS
ncbi:DUF1145 domain-containing protein [Zhongshania sp. BJYM1]|uniref:DUF1145 domain-containing protein n=1 Tax=Zhongshania aquatica TaxID=2965069 RepID=UPI0022B3CE6B|nr:DUF1145 domain-containing protein [Marortus sp. BJYM1]